MEKRPTVSQARDRLVDALADALYRSLLPSANENSNLDPPTPDHDSANDLDISDTFDTVDITVEKEPKDTPERKRQLAMSNSFNMSAINCFLNKKVWEKYMLNSTVSFPCHVPLGDYYPEN